VSLDFWIGRQFFCLLTQVYGLILLSFFFMKKNS
jgi:hypothetical protein